MVDTEVFDCIVVGAGIEGSATAYELSRRQMDVLLLDQFALPHKKGSSHGATRITRRAYNKVAIDIYYNLLVIDPLLWISKKSLFVQPEYMEMMKLCFEKWKELETLAGETLYK